MDHEGTKIKRFHPDTLNPGVFLSPRGKLLQQLKLSYSESESQVASTKIRIQGSTNKQFSNSLTIEPQSPVQSVTKDKLLDSTSNNHKHRFYASDVTFIAPETNNQRKVMSNDDKNEKSEMKYHHLAYQFKKKRSRAEIVQPSLVDSAEQNFVDCDPSNREDNDEDSVRSELEESDPSNREDNDEDSVRSELEDCDPSKREDNDEDSVRSELEEIESSNGEPYTGELLADEESTHDNNVFTNRDSLQSNVASDQGSNQQTHIKQFHPGTLNPGVFLSPRGKLLQQLKLSYSESESKIPATKTRFQGSTNKQFSNSLTIEPQSPVQSLTKDKLLDSTSNNHKHRFYTSDVTFIAPETNNQRKVMSNDDKNEKSEIKYHQLAYQFRNRRSRAEIVQPSLVDSAEQDFVDCDPSNREDNDEDSVRSELEDCDPSNRDHNDEDSVRSELEDCDPSNRDHNDEDSVRSELEDCDPSNREHNDEDSVRSELEDCDPSNREHNDEDAVRSELEDSDPSNKEHNDEDAVRSKLEDSDPSNREHNDEDSVRSELEESQSNNGEPYPGELLADEESTHNNNVFTNREMLSNVASDQDSYQQTSKATELMGNVVEVDKWVVQLYEGGVRIEGHKLEEADDQFWHSSQIIKRLSSCLLETASGSLYRLIGKIDKEGMQSEGHSDDLISQFENGFPRYWHSLLMNKAKPRSSDHEEVKCILQNKKTQHTKTKPLLLLNNSREEKCTKQNKKKPCTKTKPWLSLNNSKEKNVKSRSRSDITKKPSLNNTLLSASMLSEAGTEEDPLVLNKLPTTRSGRRIIPPLSYWTGQRVIIYPQTQCIDIIPGSQNTVKGELSLSFRSDGEIEQKEAKAIQRMIKQHNTKSNKKLKHSVYSCLRQSDYDESSVSENMETHVDTRAPSDGYSLEQIKYNSQKVNGSKSGKSHHKLSKNSSDQGRVSGSLAKGKVFSHKRTRSSSKEDHTAVVQQKSKIRKCTKNQCIKDNYTIELYKVNGSKSGKSHHKLSKNSSDQGRVSGSLAKGKVFSHKRTRSSSKEDHTAVVQQKSKIRKCTKNQCIKDNYTIEPETVDCWTDDEITRFNKYCKEVPMFVPSFWKDLSKLLKTRSAAQCKDFYYKSAGDRATKKLTKKRNHKEPITELGQVTGRVGTLKRKCQLKELVQNHQKKYSDDMFDSTPGRSLKQIKLPAFSCPSPNEFKTPASSSTRSGSRCRSEKNQDCFQTPHVRPHLLMPFSETKTPLALLPSPDQLMPVKIKNIDGYVHRIKKKYQGKQWGILRQKNSSKEPDHIMPRHVTEEITPDMFEEQPGSCQDDSDAADYYFSD